MFSNLKEKLEILRGKVSFNADMAKIVWFRTGGLADLLFEPEDEKDLVEFLKIIGPEMPLQIIGIGSNLLVRDGGIRGAVLRLGSKKFGKVKQISEDEILSECGASDKKISLFAAEAQIGGFHFYSGIPGNVGGAIAMNAGANSMETSQRIVRVRAMDRNGNIKEFTNDEMNFKYRYCGVANQYIFLSAVLKGYKSSKKKNLDLINEVLKHRNEAQPVREKTGGSTFKNLVNKAAWQVIDEAGCRGLCFGDACMSELHCNFMINKGAATAFELEQLGELVRQRVFEHSSNFLEWEIQRIGDFAAGKKVKNFNKK